MLVKLWIPKSTGISITWIANRITKTNAASDNDDFGLSGFSFNAKFDRCKERSVWITPALTERTRNVN